MNGVSNSGGKPLFLTCSVLSDSFFWRKPRKNNVDVRFFLGSGTALSDVAAVIVHAHDGAFVKSLEN
jgi:hypothetical protein